jgi:4-amino-4-deoxy-L-arabinose transferase-like glycosyltransferase
VHTDALLAGLTCAAALCALVRWAGRGGRRWVVAGGALSGLALLAKVPAVYLGLSLPLLAVVLGRRRGPRALLADLALWGLVGLVTCLALWPSLWVNPLGTAQRILEFTRRTGGQPDEVGSFFLGQAWGDPGPLFYPLALAFRLTPLASLGLLALLVLGRPLRRLLSGRWPIVLGLTLYALGFLVFLTVAPKKFDRYALPLVPALQILAGLGLWLLFRRLRPFLAGGPPWLAAAIGLVLLTAGQWGAYASVYPYSMAYFNPLLGGGPAAARTVMVGNGEGMDQVAEYFNALPRVDDIWVVSHSFDLLAARCRCDGEPLREGVPSDADYLVVYGRRIQLRRWGPSLERYLLAREPVHTVWINGIEMAQIYRGPKLERASAG